MQDEKPRPPALPAGSIKEHFARELVAYEPAVKFVTITPLSEACQCRRCVRERKFSEGFGG